MDPEFSFYSQRLQQLRASSGLASPQTGCKEKGTFCYVTEIACACSYFFAKSVCGYENRMDNFLTFF